MTTDLHPETSEDQKTLLESSARFIEAHCPLTAVRALAESNELVDAKYRKQAAELGWFAMLVPESFGGGKVSDNGLVDASMIGALRGAALQPGGFVGTNVVASTLAACKTSESHCTLIEALVSGSSAAAWAAIGPKGEPDPGAGVSAVRNEGGFVLTGSKTMVEEAAGCAALLVTAEVDGALAQFLVPKTSDGLTMQRLEALDLTRAYFDVRFEGVRVEGDAVIGAPGECDASVERQFQLACVLSLAETVGAMDHNFTATLAYARERIAFGRPIGSFQAIKHLLADTSLVLETSKAVVAAAARSVGEGTAEAGEVASLAKAYVADRCVGFTQNCFQVFGGIGYTWEHDHHLYMRRITSDSALYGSAAGHRERVCKLAGL